MKQNSGVSRRVLAVILSLGMMLSLQWTASAAQFSDTNGHWAGPVIEQWAQYNILSGFGDGTVRPNEPITVAQLATVINRIMKYKATSKSGFADVPQGSWYYEPLMALRGKGVLSEDGNMAYPDKILTREEAVMIIAKAFRVSTSIPSPSFKDAADIAPEARIYVAAMQSYGYAVGSDGFFLPKEQFTRAHVFTVINSIAKNYMNEAKQYSNLSYGNALVNVPGASLSRTIVNGDLYITPGVGSGDFSLDKVQIKGRTIIQGGGANSVVFNDSALSGKAIVDNKESQLRLVANGNTSFENDLDIYTDTILEGNFGTVNVKGENATVIIRGNVDAIHISAPNVTIIIEKDGSVDIIYADPGSQGSTISGEGSVNKIIVNANNITVKLGKVTVEVAVGITGTLVGTVSVSGGSTYTSNAFGGGYVQGGSAGTAQGLPSSYNPTLPQYVNVTGISLSKTDISLKVGDGERLEASVYPANASNPKIKWLSSNTNVVLVDNGLVIALSPGIAVVTATTVDGSHSASCYVTVESSSTPVPPQLVLPESIEFGQNPLLLTSGPDEAVYSINAWVLPENAVNKGLVWSLVGEKPNGVSWKQVGNGVELTLEPNAVGEISFNAKSVSNPSLSDELEVIIRPAQYVPVTDVDLDKDLVSLSIGESSILTATVSPVTASNKTVKWSTNNPSIVQIEELGSSVRITALAKGNALVTVTTNDGKFTADCVVTVSDQPVATFVISGTVLDKETKAPINGATVKLYNNNSEQMSQQSTATDGVYSFVGIKNGAYKIKAEASGYDASEINVSVADKDLTGQNIELTPQQDVFYSISGYVVDKDTGEGIAATLKLLLNGAQVGSSIVAGIDGSYAFSNLIAAPNYQLEISMSGYIGVTSELISIVDKDVVYPTISLEREPIPSNLVNWVYDYRVTQNSGAGYLTLIEIWLKPEYHGLVNITYDGVPFEKHQNDQDRYVFSFPEPEYNVDPLKVQIELKPYDVILDTSFVADVGVGTFAYVYIDSASGLDDDKITITADGVTTYKDSVDPWFYTSDSIPGKKVDDTVVIKVFYDGVEISQEPFVVI